MIDVELLTSLITKGEFHAKMLEKLLKELEEAKNTEIEIAKVATDLKIVAEDFSKKLKTTITDELKTERKMMSADMSDVKKEFSESVEIIKKQNKAFLSDFSNYIETARKHETELKEMHGKLPSTLVLVAVSVVFGSICTATLFLLVMRSMGVFG